MPTIYNSAYSIAFTIERDFPEEGKVTPEMYRQALLRRIDEVHANNTWEEAVGAPDDTYTYEGTAPVVESDQVLARPGALSPSEKAVIERLRARGFAVVLWNPGELGEGVNAAEFETDVTETGEQTLSSLSLVNAD